MFDLRQDLARSHNNSSVHPTYQPSVRNIKKGPDFQFWDAGTKNSGNAHILEGGEIEFQVQKWMEDDDNNRAYSPTFWKDTSLEDVRHEASPLLPYNHHYSNPSPTSRSEVIAESRKQLMEMIKDMPEMSYELSLRDMVDKQPNLQEAHKDVETEGKKCLSDKSNKVRIKQNRDYKAISRTKSMDSGVYLLKLFLPISLPSKKKSKHGNSSKVSPPPTLAGSKKQLKKSWWNISIHRSTSNLTDNRCRKAINSESGFRSFCSKKCKPRQRGCFF